MERLKELESTLADLRKEATRVELQIKLHKNSIGIEESVEEVDLSIEPEVEYVPYIPVVPKKKKGKK